MTKQSLLAFLANPPALAVGNVAEVLRADPRNADFEQLNKRHGGKKYIKMA